MLDHAQEVVTRYKGQIAEWDVVNEHHSEHVISAILHPEDPQRDPMLVELFETAKAADPSARMFINDFGILQGDKERHKASYEALIAFLLEQGAPVEGIGMQSHYFNADLRLTPEAMLATLDRFGRFGIPVQITEFDMYGGGWGETQGSGRPRRPRTCGSSTRSPSATRR